MIQAIVLAFLAGLMGFNGKHNFVQGITGREFPNLTGNSATNNAVGGLAAFAIAGSLIALAHVGDHQLGAVIAGALGGGGDDDLPCPERRLPDEREVRETPSGGVT